MYNHRNYFVFRDQENEVQAGLCFFFLKNDWFKIIIINLDVILADIWFYLNNE